MVKADEAINKLCKSLGAEYTVKTIDGEPCVYRDFGNGFNVEISGMYTTHLNRKANLYLWWGSSPIVATILDVRREDIGSTVERLRGFVEELIEAGYGGDNVLNWRENSGLREKYKLVHC